MLKLQESRVIWRKLSDLSTITAHDTQRAVSFGGWSSVTLSLIIDSVTLSTTLALKVQIEKALINIAYFKNC